MTGSKLAAAALALLLAMAPESAKAQNHRLLTSWDPNHPSTKIVTTPYVEAIKDISKGSLTLSVSGPETVPPFEQMQPVQSGAFQLLVTHGAYHYGAVGFGMGIDAIKPDRKARRESGAWAAIDAAYQTRGMKILAMPTSVEGYQFVLRRPLGPDGDLKGMKIRATPGYIPLIDAFGGAPVNLPVGEVYQALQKGTVDGAAWTAIGVPTYRFNEVASILVRPFFGSSTYLVMMNLDAWKKLDAEKQKILLDAGIRIEESAAAPFSKLAADEQKEMLDKGMKLAEFGPRQKAFIEKHWAEGLWGLVERKEGDAGKALRAFIKGKGLTD